MSTRIWGWEGISLAIKLRFSKCAYNLKTIVPMEHRVTYCLCSVIVTEVQLPEETQGRLRKTEEQSSALCLFSLVIIFEVFLGVL